ncbi:hypothetical protein N7449_007689 [Penicillium cf. viridicatum]|uniref:Uncharacterized protein n=1 Tax=Penicillium cf. viridicatum TaxID=2972119 RepID=A0A9W9JHT1_9EURO|nr:hypothetical protein N7449_007689 [Penicillium cf. viridicatum]
MPGRLEGNIALVSGSTQGFGRGILETFVREGAVVLGLDLQATDGPVDGYSENAAYQIKANVAEEETRDLHIKVRQSSVNCRSQCRLVVPQQSGLDVTVEEFDRLFNVNVRSIYLASKVLIPEMKKNGPGSTVVISSENAIRPGGGLLGHKVDGLGICQDQLRFNTICPTSGNTPLLNKFAGIADGPVPAEIIKAKCESIPIGRLVEPSDVANVALFLAEPASSIISGVEILVDGARCV